jgi:hypothetical protein
VKYIYKREYLHRKAKKYKNNNRSDELWCMYRKMRNRVSKMIRKRKHDYFIEVGNRFSNNSKRLWKELRSILPKSKNNVSIDVTADSFNTFFSSIGSETVAHLQSEGLNYKKTLPKSIHSFKFNDIDDSFVLKYLLSLSQESKNDVLNFDTKLLQIAAPYISKSLCFIFNTSLNSGHIPHDWKLARVSPAYKGKGSTNEESNFRPLSVIGHLSKLVEKCVHNQLMDYLMKHKFLSIDQHAYIKHHSTISSLHRIVDDILENVNEKEKTMLCFLDIKKCFDTIDHTILLYKLEQYGITGTELEWFRSYLHNRSQVVILNNTISKKKFMNIGVPQGTILGPILFLLYVNDLSNVVRNASINIYADDVAIYSSHSDLNILQNSMQNILNDVFDWYKDNKLILSIDKCSTMIIDNKRQNSRNDLGLSLNDRVISQVQSMKYLGLSVDTLFTWKDHISNVIQKVNGNNYRLRKLRNCIPKHLMCKLYTSLSVPIIDYAATVWGNFSKSNNNIIKRIEHRAARTITGNFDFVNVRGEELMKQLNLNSFEKRLNYNIAILMYKATHDLLPHHIDNNFTMIKDIMNREPREKNKMNLYVPKPNCELFKKSLMYKGPKIWNELPIELKQASSLHAFKEVYKRTILANR